MHALPPCAPQAKYFSFFMMNTILTSVLNFCFASVPTCEYASRGRKQDGAGFGQLALQSCFPRQTVPQAAPGFGQPRPLSRVVRASRPYRPYFRPRYMDYVLLCRPEDETAQPWFFIEAGCIMIFSAEFALRLLCCPAAVGLLNFCRNPANVIDLVRLRPSSLSRRPPTCPSLPQPALACPSSGPDLRRRPSTAARTRTFCPDLPPQTSCPRPPARCTYACQCVHAAGGPHACTLHAHCMYTAGGHHAVVHRPRRAGGTWLPLATAHHPCARPPRI